MIFLLISVFYGCDLSPVSQENFASRYSDLQCVAYKKCYRARYDGEYESMSRCVEEITEDIEDDYTGIYAECEFLPDQAQYCLDLKGESTCAEHWDDEEEINAACTKEIWNCP